MPAVLNELSLAADLPGLSVEVAVGPPGVDLLFDQPAATDADLVFGAGYRAPRNDLSLSAALPLPAVSIKFIPPARAELLAQLPGLTVQTLVLRPSVPLDLGSALGARLPGMVFMAEVAYASRTQRPTVGRTLHPWQVAQRSQDGATQGQQNAGGLPTGWKAPWRRTGRQPHGVAHRLPSALVPAPEQRRTGQQQASQLGSATWFAHQNGSHQELARWTGFQDAQRVRDSTRFRHQDGDRTKRGSRTAFWQIAGLISQR